MGWIYAALAASAEAPALFASLALIGQLRQLLSVSSEDPFNAADFPSKDEKPIVDHKLALAIGILSVEWASAQHLLTSILSELMVGETRDNDDLLHMFAIIGMDARPLIGLLRTVSVARLGRNRADIISKALDKMESAKELRDLVCHCFWQRKQDGRLLACSIKTIGKVKFIERQIKPREIYEKIRTLRKNAISIIDCVKSAGYMTEHEPFHGRPY